MALPKLESSKFDLTLPVSGSKIKFRPFLVKEQKIILQAIEMGDKSQLTNALYDALSACTFGLDVDDLPMGDIEFLTLNLRSKSAGEILDLRYRCNATIPAGKLDDEGKELPEHPCNTSIPIKLNLTSVSMDNKKRDMKIMFTDNVGVIMKNMTYGEWKEIQEIKSRSERGIRTMMAYIDYVFDSEMTYKRPDFTDEELAEWLGELNTDDLDEIEKFIKATPKLRKDLKIKCPSCGHEETVVLEGLDDFLE